MKYTFININEAQLNINIFNKYCLLNRKRSEDTVSAMRLRKLR